MRENLLYNIHLIKSHIVSLGNLTHIIMPRNLIHDGDFVIKHFRKSNSYRVRFGA